MFASITAALLVQSGTSVAADEVTSFQNSSASPNGSASAAMAGALANKARATTAPSFIKQPDYIRPEAAKSAGEFGEVVLSGIIGEDGKFTEPKVKISSRSALIDAAALASVGAMLFEPAHDANGKALSIPANLPLEYSQVAFHGPGGLAQYRCDQFRPRLRLVVSHLAGRPAGSGLQDPSRLCRRRRHANRKDRRFRR
ncbi:energy transducer TonB [Brevundimonas sp. DWR2-3-1b1]|uniref:energy transducer TonB n=1 Tax=Brevundimonas sp. DWR2-3-1b1 TaxID=2804641 RepID=UPI003CED73A1